jgi:osmotically-inducible protein OsmY
MNNLVKQVVVGGALIGVGLLGLAACVSTVTPQGRRQPDADITSRIQAALQANDRARVEQLAVETRAGVVFLTGVVDTEDARREAGRVGWSTDGVRRVNNEILIGTTHSETSRTGGL